MGLADRIAIGSDHAGLELKEAVVKFLKGRGDEVTDVGTYSKDSVDYPDLAEPVARAVSEGKADKGCLICYSGVGMSIAANKIKGIRAALCMTPEIAGYSRKHNDSNVLCLAAGFNTEETNLKIVGSWLTASFEGGRHGRRVNKISEMER
jgi:ribose 5-phosphate isomerase B